MKDSVVRGCRLQLLYGRRREGSIPFGHAEQAVPPPGGIRHRDWLRALAQLSEYRLIDWTPFEDQSGMGLLSGFSKINDFGVKVLEAGVEPPIRISIDKSRRTTVLRQQQAPIGASTPQQRYYGGTEESDHCDQPSRCVRAGEKLKRNLCCENCWVAKQRPVC